MTDLREPIQLVLNGFPLQDSHRGRGVGRYTFEVYQHILKLWEEQDPKMSAFAGITLVGAENPDLSSIFEHRFQRARFFAVSKNITNRNLAKYFYYKFSANPALTKLFKSFTERSLYFMPRHQILSHSLATYTTTMVHDFAPLKTKRWGKNPVIDPLLKIEYSIYLKELEKSQLIVTNSTDTTMAVSQQIKRENDIKTILLGNVLEHVDIEKEKKRVSPIVDPYFFYYAGFDYNKNIPGIIKAFAAFIRNHEDTNRTKLVVSGGIKDEERLVSLAKQEGILENIMLLDFIPDNDLAYYLIHSLGLFRLSFIEGCGLPEIEALSLGVPVISADIGAVREMVGGHAFLVNPHTPLAAEPILYQLAKKKVSPEKLKQDREYAKKFTWTRTAEETLATITEFVQTHKPAN